MANEMFTTREGKQVPIVPFTLDGPQMVTILRMKEDLAAHGEHLSTYGVVDYILDKGAQALRNYWKNSAKQKDNRDLGKVITFMLSKGASMQSIAQFLEEKTGKKVALDTPEPELTEAELEAATSPNSSANGQ